MTLITTNGAGGIPMKHLSLKLLSETVISRRKTMGLSQAALGKKAGINRSILSRLETGGYSPSVDQLLSLSAVLGFNPADVIVEDEAEAAAVDRKRIAVAGTGYVGLSLAVLLSQHNDVTAVDILESKVEKISRWQSPIQDEYIEKYMAEHEVRGLSLTATTDAASAYASADFIIIAAPTNYDPKTNYFDCTVNEEGLLHVLCSTTAADPSTGNLYTFSGNDGEVCTVVINIPEDFIPGTYSLFLKEVVLTPSSADKGYETAVVESLLTIKSIDTGIRTFGDLQPANGSCYNLSGQRIVAPQKGVCVVDGKKILMQ